MPVGDPAESKNFRLIGHAPDAGWGGGSLVEVKDGFAYVGAIGLDGNEGITVHDVTDPRRPKRVAEVKAPPNIHMHKVRVVGDDLLYANAERKKGSGDRGARTGFYIYDISEPARIREAGFCDLPGGGPHRFGVDHERRLAFFPNAAEGWRERIIWTFDIRDPLRPDLISRWGLPEQDLNQNIPYEEPLNSDRTWTCHGPPVIRGDRMFCGFWGAGMVIIDSSDLSDMRLVKRYGWSPPFEGATHTVWPVGGKPYVVVTDEGRTRENFWESQFMWVIDIREETNPIPISKYIAPREKYFHRGSRFGAHNIVENLATDGPFANLVFLTYFSAGLRVIDISDPFEIKEVGHYVPACDFGKPAVQSNDLTTDAEGRIYLIDRWGGGMHILEYTG